jgi:hypothetical protein
MSASKKVNVSKFSGEKFLFKCLCYRNIEIERLNKNYYIDLSKLCIFLKRDHRKKHIKRERTKESNIKNNYSRL